MDSGSEKFGSLPINLVDELLDAKESLRWVDDKRFESFDTLLVTLLHVVDELTGDEEVTLQVIHVLVVLHLCELVVDSLLQLHVLLHFHVLLLLELVELLALHVET
jgi:hypothetical protein